MLAKSMPFLSLDKDKLQFPSKEGSSSVCFKKTNTKQSTNFLGFVSILTADGSRWQAIQDEERLGSVGVPCCDAAKLWTASFGGGGKRVTFSGGIFESPRRL